MVLNKYYLSISNKITNIWKKTLIFKENGRNILDTKTNVRLANTFYDHESGF